jgi:hypothetical protein
VSVGIQTDLLIADLEASVVGRIHVGLNPQQLAVQLGGLGDVADGIDEETDALDHDALLADG